MKAVVLTSGGIDSSTCLAFAVSKLGKSKVTALRVDYGQRHRKELVSARQVADYFGVRLYTLDLAACFSESECPLLAGAAEKIPEGSYGQQQREAPGVVSTYVPFRNGIFLAAAASMAMGIYPEGEVALYIGAHADDAAGNAYPDCSTEFVAAFGEALRLGTDNRVKLEAPFVSLNKAQVVTHGLALEAPYHLTWSCYVGGDEPCGKCATCIDRAAAFAANGVPDPALGASHE